MNLEMNGWSKDNVIEESGCPLISVLLLSYNQQQFIREAVEGLFSQTYSPLEIILSDDCSSDNTYQIMEELAKHYNGPHRIQLNRNKTNLGISAHLNRCMELSHGELIVCAAGDDISLSNRVQRIYQAWTSSDSTNSILSNLEIIDENGTSLGPMFSSPPVFAKNINDFKNGIACWVIGASFSFERRLYSKYGGIDSAIRQEDGCLAFRALLEGQIAYMDEILVKYRHHGGNVSQTDDPAKRLFLQKSQYYMKRGWLADAEKSGCSDRELIHKLRIISARSYVGKLFFSCPFIGFAYNYLRINTKMLLNKIKMNRVAA